LGQAAAGDDLEPALLAQDLLEEMGEVLFMGGRVRLVAVAGGLGTAGISDRGADHPAGPSHAAAGADDHIRISWDEPVTLTVHVDNPTPGHAVVPWPADTLTAPTPGTSQHPSPDRSGRSGTRRQTGSDDAGQVAAFMDIADHLVVSDPDGNPIEPRVDPIEQDTAVDRAVQIRASDHPPSHSIPPGASEDLVVPQLNRGWARYPMLDVGKYTVQFVYQPQWKDPAWTAQGFGLIHSNTITVEVTEPAPIEIRRATRPVKLTLSREEGRLVAELQNTWDRELWLNLNIGGPPETHARLQWRPQSKEGPEVGPFQLDADATGPRFSPDRLKRLCPGEKVVVSRADAATVLQRCRLAGSARPDARRSVPVAPVLVSARYIHVPSAQALRSSLREKGRRERIPTQLFSGSAASDAVTLWPEP